MEVRLDDVNSQPVASIDFSTSNWQVVRNKLSKEITGTHDMYLVFSAPDISLESWQFSNLAVPEITTTPTASPSESIPASQPAVTKTPESTGSDIINMKVDSKFESSVSQNYTITPKNGSSIDLSKLKIRFHYKKSGNTAQAFCCDTAACQLPVAPYYTCLTGDVTGTFGDGYLEIGFNNSYQLTQGSLNVNIRFNQTDWSAYKDFAAGSYDVIYDGHVVKTIQ